MPEHGWGEVRHPTPSNGWGAARHPVPSYGWCGARPPPTFCGWSRPTHHAIPYHGWGGVTRHPPPSRHPLGGRAGLRSRDYPPPSRGGAGDAHGKVEVVRVCMCVYVYVSRDPFTCACMYVCMYVCTGILYLYMCVHVHRYLYMCVRAKGSLTPLYIVQKEIMYVRV